VGIGVCFFGTAKALTVSNGIVHVGMEKCATRDRVMLYFIGVYSWTLDRSHSGSCHGLLESGHVYQWKASKSVSLMARTV